MTFVNINQKSDSSNMMIERSRVSAGFNSKTDLYKSAKYWASVFFLNDNVPTDITNENGRVIVSYKILAKNAEKWIKQYSEFEIC